MQRGRERGMPVGKGIANFLSAANKPLLPKRSWFGGFGCLRGSRISVATPAAEGLFKISKKCQGMTSALAEKCVVAHEVSGH